MASLAIINDIILLGRETIVECGSGNSSVFAARALAHYGSPGRIHSIDHDPRWANQTCDAIAAEHLQPWANVICAPLVDNWYDRTLLPRVRDIDLLIVDGPPAHERGTETARQAALDEFSMYIQPGATVLLDDTRRRGERIVPAAWEDRYNVKFHPHPGGCAMASWPRGNP
jgi:uncharacterized SAM-dependent methyltransferase